MSISYQAASNSASNPTENEAVPPAPARIDAPAYAALGVFALLLFALAWPMLSWWNWEYTRPESYYGHAFFVPVLSGVMLWHKRDTLRAISRVPCTPALIFCIFFLGLLLLAVKTQMEAVMSVSFLSAIISAIWFIQGTKWTKTAAFPLLFLFLMAPLPGPVLNDLTIHMQSASTVGAAKMLKVVGLSPVQNGNLIRLENYTLNVDVPCSGFKLLLRLLTFSAAFAFLSETTRLKRLAIFAFSLPLSLFINALRIALIGLVGEAMGATAAATFHDWSGLITTILCMGLLLGFARGLGCRRFAGQPIF